VVLHYSLEHEKGLFGVRRDNPHNIPVLVWIVPPNPEKAFLMLQAVMEYHLPKLARVESVGDEAAPQRMVISWKRPE